MRATFVQFVCFSLLTMLASTRVSAAEIMRAGMWELTTTSELLKLVPQISPDQMRNLRAMAKQYGMEMPEINQGAATAKICVTPQMAQQNVMPELSQRYAGCETGNANRFGNHYSVDITCDSQQIRGKGSASGVFTTSESFAGKSSFDGVVQGMPITQTADTQGKWVSAVCNVGGSGSTGGKSLNR